MMTSSNGNIFRVTGHLCGEFTGLRWIRRTKASDAEFWCFLWYTPKVNNREAGDVRRQHGHYDVIVMVCCISVHDSTRKSCIKVIILVCGWCQSIPSKSKCPIQVCVFQIFHIFVPVVYQHKMQTGFCWGCINMVFFFLTCIPKYCLNGTGTILLLPK